MPLTPIQFKTSTAVSAAVHKFPTAMSDLVSQYAIDYSEAAFPLEFNKKNRLQNPALGEYVKDALISCECDVKIKRGIFQLAQDYRYKPELNKILVDIGKQGHSVNLDGADLSYLDLYEYDLRGISAIGANFSHSTMINTKLDKSNLTGAVIMSSNLENASFIDANLYKACITDSNLKRAQLSRMIAWGMVLLNVETDQTEVTGIVTDNRDMRTVVFENLRWGMQGKFVSELSLRLFDENHYRENVARNRCGYKIRA